MPVDDLRAQVRALMPEARADLARLVAIPSVADPRQYDVRHCLDAAGVVAQLLTGAGVRDVRLLDMPYGHPAVYGHTPAPPGAPTVLLYSHYDVQPPLDEAAWRTPVWTLTERDGRWFGRGAADCKGNIVMHLTALRALSAVGAGSWPVGVTVLVEGSEEQALGELEEYVPGHRDLLAADAVVIADAGNVAAGVPTLTVSLRGLANVVVTVRALASAVHSGMFGGAAPDPLAALIHMLASLRNAAGDTTVRGLDASQVWPGAAYPPEQFRADATVLPGVDLVGSGSVADMVWARPAVTVLGIDYPPVVGSVAAVQPQARARVSLRVPPGMSARAAMDALVTHLHEAAPWHVEVDIAEESPGEPWLGRTDGPAATVMAEAMQAAYGRPHVLQGQGGSIPLCTVLQDTFPDAEQLMIGVEDPRCLIHSANESVDPGEVERMALVEALFLSRYGAARR